MLLIVVNMMTSVFDVVNKLLDQGGAEVKYLRLTTMGYFITHLFALPLIFFYILTTVKNWYELDNRFKITIILPIIIEFIALFTNPFTHFVYNYNDDGSYVKGTGYIMLYMVVAVYLGLIIYMLFYYKEYFSVVKRVTIAILFVLLIVSMGVQAISYTTRFESFGITYSLLVMFFLLQNPRDLTDKETGLYNGQAFFEIMKQNIAARKYFNIIEVIVTDYDEVMREENDSEYKSLAKQMGEFLSELNENINVYRVESNIFCMEAWDVSEEDLIGLIRTIRGRFKKPWRQGTFEVLYNVRMCHIALPEEIDSISKLSGIIRGSSKGVIDKELLSVSDFDLGLLERQSRLNAAIETALDEERIDMVFSPVCLVQDKKIVAIDTALRITDREIGYIEEEEIMEFAEKHGRLGKLTRQQISKLVSFILESNPESLGLEMVETELTAAMCYQAGFIDFIIETVKNKKINPNLICFKISEYTVHRDPELITSIMDKLRGEGFRFCLDDYGSGFTNLASIYEQPFDVIKISNTIVKAAFENTKAMVTLMSSLELAKDLNMRTIVSGVSDDRYFDFVLKSGCEYTSGEYFLEKITDKELINILVAQENVTAFSNIGRSVVLN